MLYRLTISLLSTAMLLGGAVTGLAQNWRHGEDRSAFRANQGAQARLVRDDDRGRWRGERWRGDRDWGRRDFDRHRGYYWGGRGDRWGAYGYAGPSYYYSPAPYYYYTPAPGYVYQAPSYYYYYPYGYAYYPEYGNGVDLNLQFGGD